MSLDNVVGEAAGEATSARPMRRDAARNRVLLIEAGRDVFARRGLDASLDEIARQAGVGVGTAYRHFANKYDLATAIMHERIGEVRHAAEVAAQAPDPWPALAGFFETVLELQADDRGLREVMMGVHDTSKSDQLREQVSGPLEILLRRARDAGQVRPDVALSDVGLLIMMLCTASDVGAAAVPDLWRRFLPALLSGLRPDGPGLEQRALTEDEFAAAMSDVHHQQCRAPSRG